MCHQASVCILPWKWCIFKRCERTFNPFTADPVKALHFAILVQPTIFNFWHSGALLLSLERQSARMSKIKNGRLDQYGAGRLRTAAVWNSWRRKGYGCDLCFVCKCKYWGCVKTVSSPSVRETSVHVRRPAACLIVYDTSFCWCLSHRLWTVVAFTKLTQHIWESFAQLQRLSSKSCQRTLPVFVLQPLHWLMLFLFCILRW